MSRLNKLISITILVLFILACNFVTEPISDVQNIAGTAQSIASALPMETLQALASQVASQVPVETFQALPSAVPSLEAFATEFGDLFNPQGTPVQVWREIPILPQATAGQEFEGGNYSFKVNATSKEVQDYYNAELPKLGWEELSTPTQGDTVVMIFSKGNNILTINVTASESETLVWLLLI